MRILQDLRTLQKEFLEPRAPEILLHSDIKIIEIMERILKDPLVKTTSITASMQFEDEPSTTSLFMILQIKKIWYRFRENKGQEIEAELKYCIRFLLQEAEHLENPLYERMWNLIENNHLEQALFEIIKYQKTNPFYANSKLVEFFLQNLLFEALKRENFVVAQAAFTKLPLDTQDKSLSKIHSILNKKLVSTMPILSLSNTV